MPRGLKPETVPGFLDGYGSNGGRYISPTHVSGGLLPIDSRTSAPGTPWTAPHTLPSIGFCCTLYGPPGTTRSRFGLPSPSESKYSWHQPCDCSSLCVRSHVSRSTQPKIAV